MQDIYYVSMLHCYQLLNYDNIDRSRRRSYITSRIVKLFFYSSIHDFLNFAVFPQKYLCRVYSVYLLYANIEYGNDINIEWQTIDSYYQLPYNHS